MGGIIHAPGEQSNTGGGGTQGGGSGTGGSKGSGTGGTVGGGTGGTVGGGTGGTVGGGSGTGGMMMTGMRSTPGDLPLPRLSHDEYIATITDLVGQVLPADASQILSTINPMMVGLPADALVTIPTEKHGGFARDDQSEQQQYSDLPVSVAAALAQAMTSSKTRIATLFGSCSNSGASVDAACLQSFIKSFGPIALRHPLSADDVTFYAATAIGNPPTTADLASVIAVMLASPRFLYRVESGAAQVSDNVYTLDAWEQAARLSYHFWGTMPDATLRDAAASGKLATDDGYAAEIDRLFADPRADATIRAFFQQWLWPLLELPALDSRVGDPVYKAFAGANLPGPTLRDHMIGDVLDAASWVVKNGGTMADLMRNKLSFARDKDLADIYGLGPWNGQGTPPTLPDPRVGLLSRAAFLSTGTINSRPIMKGVFIRETLLCDTVPAPPNNAANTPIVLGPNQTTREVITAITEASGTVCAGCHKGMINPLGFASENFDGLGRARTKQIFYDDTGKVTGDKAVDTTGIPVVTDGDTTTTVAGLGDLTELLVKSGKLEACMARRFFRFAFRRIETSVDSEAIDGLAKLANGGKLADMFKGVAFRPEFKQRVIAQ